MPGSPPPFSGKTCRERRVRSLCLCVGGGRKLFDTLKHLCLLDLFLWSESLILTDGSLGLWKPGRLRLTGRCRKVLFISRDAGATFIAQGSVLVFEMTFKQANSFACFSNCCTPLASHFHLQVSGRKWVRWNVRQSLQVTCASLFFKGAGDAPHNDAQL